MKAKQRALYDLGTQYYLLQPVPPTTETTPSLTPVEEPTKSVLPLLKYFKDWTSLVIEHTF